MFNLFRRNKELKTKKQPEWGSFLDQVRNRFATPLSLLSEEEAEEKIAKLDARISKFRPIEVRARNELETVRNSLMMELISIKLNTGQQTSYRRIDMDSLINETLLGGFWRSYTLPGFAIFDIKTTQCYIKHDSDGYRWWFTPEILSAYKLKFALEKGAWCRAELGEALLDETLELISQSEQDFEEIYLLGKVTAWEPNSTVLVPSSDLVVIGQKSKSLWLIERKPVEEQNVISGTFTINQDRAKRSLEEALKSLN